MSDWFKANKLSLNLDKTVGIKFWDNSNFMLHTNNMSIEMTDHTKFLGVFIDHKLTWHICRDPMVEEGPNGITVHSLPPMGRRAALIQTQLLRSPLPKGRGSTRAIRPEQAKQQKRCEDYLTF